MDVLGGLPRGIILNYASDVGEVQAPRGDVGAQEERGLLGVEALKCGPPGIVLHVPVKAERLASDKRLLPARLEFWMG